MAQAWCRPPLGLPTPTLQISAPASGTANTLITAASITATLSSSLGTNPAAINVWVYGPNATAPTTCTGAGWTQVGASINSTGSAAYHPSAGYTPTNGGTYYWYATYAGDANNGPTATACGASMTSTAVVGPDTFSFAAIGTKTAGAPFNVTLTANLWSGGTDSTYTGVKCLTFTGPVASRAVPWRRTRPREAAPASSSITFASGSRDVQRHTLQRSNDDVDGDPGDGNRNLGVVHRECRNSQHASSSRIAPQMRLATSDPCAASISVGNGGYATLHVSVLDAWGNLTTVTGAPLTVTLSNSPAGNSTSQVRRRSQSARVRALRSPRR